MRRYAALILLLFLACRTISFLPQATSTHSSAPTSDETLSPSLSPTSTRTLIQTATATPGAFPATAIATIPESRLFIIRFHPDGPLYVGDLVSVEVIPPPGIDVEDRRVQIEFDDFKSKKPAEEKFSSYGIGARLQATFQWVWDTTGLTAGDHSLTFSIQPGGPTWRETVSLLPRGEAPPPEPHARWASTESDCCLVNYINHTAVERDLSSLLDILDKQAEVTGQQFKENLSEAVTVTFLPRVLGHGGFASQGISVSYLDRNYTGGDPATIIHHEMVHVLDGRLGGELRPTMLIEGLAVYLSGGHFKPEALMQRAAALLPPTAGCIPWTSSSSQVPLAGEMEGCGLDLYVDFSSLVDNFYLEQHEAGYLEASALVEFMVETWGWDAFSEFYRDIHTPPDPSEGFQQKYGVQYRAMDIALGTHFGITLEQLEKRYLLELSQEKLTPEQSEDVRLTVLFYDSVRRYQQLLDPSAYFLTTWIPDVDQMRKRGIVADYLRRPANFENLALESMFVTANSNLLTGRYDRTANLLNAANAVMDSFPKNGNLAFAVDPIAADYYALVEAVSTEGFTPERIQIDGDNAQIWASKYEPALIELLYVRDSDGWILKSGVEPLSTDSVLSKWVCYGQFHSQLNIVSNGGLQYKSCVSN